MAFPKRGSFAKDIRTGQIVQVREESHGGTTWMVRTARKSDGYWVATANLEPAKNPHDLNRSGWFLLLIVLSVAVFTAYRVGTEIYSTGNGLPFAVVVAVSTCYAVFVGLVQLTGLFRS